jgi:hypothetical protein
VVLIRSVDRIRLGEVAPNWFASLSQVGRGEKLTKARPGTDVVAHDTRVEIHRPGLIEWYVNSSEGLEQGFFCDDDMQITFGTDPPGGASRTYSSFSAAAQEAGRSRVVGGIHFQFSNQGGLEAGGAVARPAATAVHAPRRSSA